METGSSIFQKELHMNMEVYVGINVLVSYTAMSTCANWFILKCCTIVNIRQ